MKTNGNRSSTRRSLRNHDFIVDLSERLDHLEPPALSRLRRRTSNRTVSGAAMAHSPPSSSRMAVAVGCMHGNADLRVNGIVPRPPRDHAARIRISGLPALLDRGLREIDVPRIALAVERRGIDLHNMHHSSAAVPGELPSLRCVSL